MQYFIAYNELIKVFFKLLFPSVIAFHSEIASTLFAEGLKSFFVCLVPSVSIIIIIIIIIQFYICRYLSI